MVVTEVAETVGLGYLQVKKFLAYSNLLFKEIPGVCCSFGNMTPNEIELAIRRLIAMEAPLETWFVFQLLPKI